MTTRDRRIRRPGPRGPVDTGRHPRTSVEGQVPGIDVPMVGLRIDLEASCWDRAASLEETLGYAVHTVHHLALRIQDHGEGQIGLVHELHVAHDDPDRVRRTVGVEPMDRVELADLLEGYLGDREVRRQFDQVIDIPRVVATVGRSKVVVLSRSAEYVTGSSDSPDARWCRRAESLAARFDSVGSPIKGAFVPFVEVADLRLYYEAVGDGPPVLVIPGLGADTRMYAALAKDLAESFRVVVFDPRGAGKSSKPPGPYSVGLMAEDARTVVRSLELGTCDLVGHSLGGRVALELAATHPEEVGHLALVATAARSLRPRALSWGWVATEILGRLPLPRRFDPQPRWAHDAQVQAAREFDGRPLLGHVLCPTLVVRAARDRIVSSALTEELGAIAGARFVELPGGHLTLVVNRHRALADTLIKFLTGT